MGGIVNAVDYSPSTIRPGTVVAAFGTNYLPQDKIVIRQFPNQWVIQIGSPWWYDSHQQINATLPGNLQPGLATMTVQAANGLESLSPRSFVVNP